MIVQGHHSKVKSMSHHDVAHKQCPRPCQVSTSHALQFLRYSLDMMLNVKVTTARLKIK